MKEQTKSDLSSDLSQIDLLAGKWASEQDEDIAYLISYLSASFRLGHLFVTVDNQEIYPVINGNSDFDRLRQGFAKIASSEHVVKEGTRLFLRRAWTLSQEIDFHTRRLKLDFSIDFEKAKMMVQEYVAKGELFDEQAEAILAAMKSSLFCIWGGPGTGKTYTAGIFLTIFLSCLLKRGVKPRIACTAPTGKATNNLAKSIQRACTVADFVPDIKTVHALLAIRQLGQRKSDDTSILPYDLLIIDESSMIDASLCAKLLSRLANGSRLLFLGDPAQLPPVEPGNPFTALVEAQGSAGKLTTSHRTELRPILDLAALVKAGKEEETIAFLKERQNASHEPGVTFYLLDQMTFSSLVSEHVKKLYSSPQLFKRQMLSPLKVGLFGTEEVNAQIYQEAYAFAKRGNISLFEPLVVTKNEYQLGLSNGQIGLGVEGGNVLFEGVESGAFRAIPRVLLSGYERAYCLSVHKSQGSEFDSVILLLPPGSERFGRKMLYTAITRTRKQLEIWASEETLRAIVRKSA